MKTKSNLKVGGVRMNYNESLVSTKKARNVKAKAKPKSKRG